MPRPIGFWLKLVDGLIDERFEQTLASRDVTRRQWQLLNALGSSPATSEELDQAVAPFLDGAEGDSSVGHLAGLVDRGWVARDGDAYAVTDSGAVACAELDQVVGQMRRQVAAGIDEAEYASTLAVLERMARNLGWQDPDA